MLHIVTLLLFSSIIFAAVNQFCFNKNDMMMMTMMMVMMTMMGHSFMMSTKIEDFDPSPLSTCVHMRLTPCRRPHAANMKYTSLS